MRGKTLKFRLKQEAPFEALCCVHGHPEAKFKAVFATRFSPAGVIPLSQLPAPLVEELLASPPTRDGDPRMIVGDIFFGNMKCVERSISLDVFADNMTWTSTAMPLLLCEDKEMTTTLIGNEFMMSQWNEMRMSGTSVEVVPSGIRKHLGRTQK